MGESVGIDGVVVNDGVVNNVGTATITITNGVDVVPLQSQSKQIKQKTSEKRAEKVVSRKC